METLARPNPNAKDSSGHPISFALVDIDVAPDGSLYLTEHNQGIWRIFYDPKKTGALPTGLIKPKSVSALGELLTLPQPGSEWSRLEAERIMANMGPGVRDELVSFARVPESPLDRRLAAIRLLAPHYNKFNLTKTFARDRLPEIRSHAAWLAGLRGRDDLDVLKKLVRDEDPFVRRRAFEALTRHAAPRWLPEIEAGLSDRDRTVRYTAMIVLAHLPLDSWFGRLEKSSEPQVLLRALTAASLRGEKPSPIQVRAITTKLTNLENPKITTRENMLDLIRVLELYETELKSVSYDQELNFVRAIASNDPEISWERARLLSDFHDALSIPSLLKELLATKDFVRQFHFFQCLAKIPNGWTPENETRALNWAVTTQSGWFADFNNKGVEFPLFLQTTLEEFAANHKEAVFAAADKIQYESLLGSALLGLIAEKEPGRLFKLYDESTTESRRVKILQAMARVRTGETAAFLRRELSAAPPPSIRKAALTSLKAMPPSPENEQFLHDAAAPKKAERMDAEIYNALLSAKIDAGDATRGRRIYESLQCNSCHAGGKTPGQEGRLFGPDLSGVTSRLTRAELADAIVYPSKQVADRFKAVALTLKDGRELTGFITEKSANHITFADSTTVYRLTPIEIIKTAPQEKSLMPEGLLRISTDQDIADLLKFLSNFGAASSSPP
jgi:putative heme-binding domain-containing protein